MEINLIQNESTPGIDVVPSCLLTATSTTQGQSAMNGTRSQDDTTMRIPRYGDSRVRKTSITSGAHEVNKEEIEDMIIAVLSKHLESVEYEPKYCGKKCPILSEIIEKNIRRRCAGQYKILSVVFIGALRDKGLEMASQCLHSPQNDCFALAYYSNQSLFAAAAVFVVLL